MHTRRYLLYMLLAPVLLAAGDHPVGWASVKWGMTEDQILAVVPGATRTDKGIAAKTELAGMPFAVLIAAGQVALSPANRQDWTDSTYQTLEFLLVAKYGRPWRGTVRSGSSAVQWTFPATIIRLTRVPLPDG